MSWDYIGNPWAVELLQQQVLAETTRHAYLIAGPIGIGRRTLALRFVQAMQCLQPNGPAEPCRGCRTCRQIEAMQYPDLQMLELLEGKSEISKDQVRQSRQFLSLAPFQSKFKTVIIRDFQLASEGTQDALLKTLEETPGSAKIIITVDAVENLLTTTISRCEVLKLRPVPAEELSSILISRLSIEPAKAHLLGHISGGRYGYAKALAENDNQLEKRQAWLEDWIAIAEMNRLQRFKWVESAFPRKNKLTLKDKRRELVEMLNTWMSYHRDLLLLSSGSSSGLVNIDMTDRMQLSAARITPASAVTNICCLEQAVNRVERYLNPRLVMEALMLELEET